MDEGKQCIEQNLEDTRCELPKVISQWSWQDAFNPSAANSSARCEIFCWGSSLKTKFPGFLLEAGHTGTSTFMTDPQKESSIHWTLHSTRHTVYSLHRLVRQVGTMWIKTMSIQNTLISESVRALTLKTSVPRSWPRVSHTNRPFWKWECAWFEQLRPAWLTLPAYLCLPCFVRDRIWRNNCGPGVEVRLGLVGIRSDQ